MAVNDSYSVAEGGVVLSPQSLGLLLNDTDADTVSTGLRQEKTPDPFYSMCNTP
ncbi:MAG: hypothetical protein K2Q17_02880 [Nitrospiraceae bacterium]|nr:hypothetical protein [Nitrospiraceae bacterium]